MKAFDKLNIIVFGALAILVLINGCASAPPRPLVECKTMCTGHEVDEFHDDTLTCKCQLSRDDNE